MLHYFKIIVITQIKINQYLHSYFVIEHNYSQSVIYNFKFELEFWRNI
jgi:hypothetical protein